MKSRRQLIRDFVQKNSQLELTFSAPGSGSPSPVGVEVPPAGLCRVGLILLTRMAIMRYDMAFKTLQGFCSVWPEENQMKSFYI